MEECILEDNETKETVCETAIEKYVRCTKETLEEGRLSKYWKYRAERRSKNAKREPKNEVDKNWAKEQQEKSSKINSRIHKLAEKEIQQTEEITEEVEAFLERVKKDREEYKKRMLEKASLKSPKDKRSKKTLPNPYSDAKVTDEFPFSKDRTGGVAKVYRKRSKKAGGPTMASGETRGQMEEGK